MADRVLQTDALEAPLYFLERNEIWDSTKPYTFQYYTKEKFPRTNVLQSPSLTRINDMRSHCTPATLEAEGFTFSRFSSKMQHSDFQDEEKVASVYCRELESHFLDLLGAKHVRALDYQVRRRLPEYPYFGGKIPPSPQPSLLTHADATLQSAEQIVRELYGKDAEQVLQSRFQIITVWKPCRGPVKDWPLAVCDATSVERSDLLPADVIYPNYLAENCMIHFNPNQRWYWLPEQESDEILIFKAIDSSNPTSSYPVLGPK
ncbi:hypothetical protein ISF_02202 [Cordyceps fumosorosea ARSEF 2679]|uniref:Uncharacterized protein n=1 Tax=Cordyceps fumosorosea (strain ARSEF 2679) TaxID=1081104 RepID=A0A168BKH2_CORFA|nr:hypothetical protein ISF_02202 [Cordyceps fumosorosea ARSEF 2679]OAA70228.1 hypothetical protein ISF_02202 [Cordyceps fumosorosea ARSEF 2679]